MFSPSLAATYLALRDNSAWLTRSQIDSITGFSAATTNRSLNYLIDKGMVEVVKRGQLDPCPVVPYPLLDRSGRVWYALSENIDPASKSELDAMAHSIYPDATSWALLSDMCDRAESEGVNDAN